MYNKLDLQNIINNSGKFVFVPYVHEGQGPSTLADYIRERLRCERYTGFSTERDKQRVVGGIFFKLTKYPDFGKLPYLS